MRALHAALSNIGAVATREFREFRREPILILLSVVSPVLIFLVFSYGFSLDVKDIPFSYVDLCRTPTSRAYVDSFSASGYFDPVAERLNLEELRDDLLRDRTRFGLLIPEDFSRRLARDSNAEVQVLINGTVASRAVVVKGYVEGANADFNRRLLERYLAVRLAGSEAELEPVALLATVWFNPSLDSIYFLVPAVAAFALFIFPAMMTSIALSREKETGMIFNVYTSPLTRLQYICGKTVLYVAVSMVNFLILFILTLRLFRVPFRGDFLIMALLTLLFVTGSAGIGLLVAVLVRTQVAALLITAISTFLPGFLYSGFFMPIESMGLDAQLTSAALPITYYIAGARQSFLKGVGWEYLWPQALGMLIFIVAVYGLTLALFKKRIG